jgi:hypothetical protein
VREDCSGKRSKSACSFRKFNSITLPFPEHVLRVDVSVVSVCPSGGLGRGASAVLTRLTPALPWHLSHLSFSSGWRSAWCSVAFCGLRRSRHQLVTGRRCSLVAGAWRRRGSAANAPGSRASAALQGVAGGLAGDGRGRRAAAKKAQARVCVCHRRGAALCGNSDVRVADTKQRGDTQHGGVCHGAGSAVADGLPHSAVEAGAAVLAHRQALGSRFESAAPGKGRCSAGRLAGGPRFVVALAGCGAPKKPPEKGRRLIAPQSRLEAHTGIRKSAGKPALF